MPTQQVRITASARLALLLCALHFAAAGAVWLTPLATWARGALVLAIAGSLVFYLARNAALHAPDAIIALEVREEGAILFQTRRGEWLECDLLPSSFVSRHVTIVNLKPRGRQRVRHVILVPDNVDARDFRRLRTWLRWAAQPPPQP